MLPSKGGYVEVQYGQRRRCSPAPIDLGSGQTIEADFNLPRGGGGVRGRITDEIGEPALGGPAQAVYGLTTNREPPRHSDSNALTRSAAAPRLRMASGAPPNAGTRSCSRTTTIETRVTSSETLVACR